MTRETKIGLLVGLAFIIVIGILLSDHFSSAMKPPEAPVVQVAPNVRRGVQVYGQEGTNGGQTPPVIRNTEPDRELYTTPRPQPNDGGVGIAPQQSGPQVQVLPPAPQPYSPLTQGHGNTGRGTPVQPHVAPVPPQPQPQPQPGPVVIIPQPPVDGGGNTQPNNTLNLPPVTPPVVVPPPDRGNEDPHAPPPGAREYVAQRGDTVSKMAERLLGSNAKANQDAIIRLNLALQVNPNKVAAGEKYYVPVAPVAPTPAPVVTPVPTPAPTPVTPNPVPPTTVTEATMPRIGETVYTTRPGDSLWKIANEQYGGASRALVAQIQELNKDVLKGSIALKPNMKLRLPPKVVASTNAND